MTHLAHLYACREAWSNPGGEGIVRSELCELQLSTSRRWSHKQVLPQSHLLLLIITRPHQSMPTGEQPLPNYPRISLMAGVSWDHHHEGEQLAMSVLSHELKLFLSEESGRASKQALLNHFAILQMSLDRIKNSFRP